MKTSILKYIPFFIFITFLTNCTVKDITVDPATGEKKSLIMISPDYLKTTIQVRLRDADTKAFLKNEMVVKVYSNKKVIDFGGRYKNEFTVKNGILNFAIDPNEDISTASPLILRVMSSVPGEMNVNSAYIPALSSLTMTSPGSKVLLLQQNKLVTSAPQSFSGIKPLTFSSIPFYISIDGNKMKFWDGSPFKVLDMISPWEYIFRKEPNLYDVSYIDYFSQLKSSSTRTYKINYNPGVDSILTDYSITFDYLFKYYTVFKSGRTKARGYFFNSDNIDSKIDGFNGDIKRSPEENSLFRINVKMYTNDIGSCPSGYSFAFSGLGNSGTEVEYALSRKNVNGESFPTNSGILKLNGIKSAAPSDVTEQDITFGKLSNTVTFSPNPEYTVEPQTMDLGDSTSCGKTFNFKLTPKAGLTKYKIILKAGCSGKSISILPNLTSLYKLLETQAAGIVGSPLYGVDFVGGTTTLYLTPTGKYSFEGEYNGKNFNFNLSTNLNDLAGMRTSTLAANPDIKDISYEQGITADGNKMITINLNFSEKSCPF
jgi:hypothetical protein